MSEIFKTFNKDDVSKRDFRANKLYTVNLTGFSASYRPEQPLEFGNPNAPIVPTIYGYVGKADRFTEFNSGSEDLNSMVAIPSRSIWDNLWHLYYRDWPEPSKVFCTSGDSREHRELYDTAYVISVPHYMYGEGIMRGTVNLEFNSVPAGQTITLKDDKYGNLYNTAYPTSSGDGKHSSIPPNQGTVLYLPFKDLTPYQYMPAYGAGFLDEQLPSGSIKDFGMYETIVRSNRVKVVTGSAYGTGIEFTGQYGTASAIPNTLEAAKYSTSWSYATIKPASFRQGGHLDFVENEDFAISFYVKVPASAQYDTDKNENMIFSPRLRISSGSALSNNPFGGQSFFAAIQYENTDNKIVAKRRDGGGQTSQLTSTTSVNDDKWHHILYQKSGSSMELWVDFSKESTATHVDSGQIRNNQNFVLGAQVSDIEGALDLSTNTRPIEDHVMRAFRGQIDEFRLYSGSFTSEQINYMSASNGTGKNHWGNVFYGHGQIVLTHPSSAYISNAPSASEVQFRGTTTITENLYSCNIKANEFNQTLNPSTIENHKTKKLHNYTNSDVWNPYVTRIGLYNDEGELLVIGSMAQPIQKIPEYDMTFIVRFDT